LVVSGSAVLEGPKGRGPNNHCGGQITDWLLTYIASDQSDIGVAYSLHNASFFTRNASMLQQQLKAVVTRVDACMYASLAELRALARVFGPYVMVDLAKKLGMAAEEWVMNLAGVLKDHEGTIAEARATLDVRGLRDNAHLTQAARQTHTIFKNLGRFLLMRQLSSLAYTMEHADAAPGFVAGTACAQKELPRHGHMAEAATSLLGMSPADVGHEESSADPLLVALLQQMPEEEFQRWELLPVAAALTVWAGEWGSAAWMGEWSALSNDMHCTLHVTSSLAAAVARAAQLRDGDGDREAAPSFHDMLAEFSATAEKLVLTEGSPHPSQVLLLSAVVSRHGPQAVFSDSLGKVCMRHTQDPYPAA